MTFKQAIHDLTLRWVQRKTGSSVPFLARGYRQSPDNCALARSLGPNTRMWSWLGYEKDGTIHFSPPYVWAFIWAFDRKRYPELDLFRWNAEQRKAKTQTVERPKALA